MTANEKAATFIGWDASRRTECTCDQKYGEPDNFYNESGLRCHWHKAGSAPNMDLPDNYSKALTAIVMKYGAIQITLTRGAVSIATPGFAHHLLENGWAFALAALYDSERALELTRQNGKRE